MEVFKDNLGLVRGSFMYGFNENIGLEKFVRGGSE